MIRQELTSCFCFIIEFRLQDHFQKRRPNCIVIAVNCEKKGVRVLFCRSWKITVIRRGVVAIMRNLIRICWISSQQARGKWRMFWACRCPKRSVFSMIILQVLSRMVILWRTRKISCRHSRQVKCWLECVQACNLPHSPNKVLGVGADLLNLMPVSFN